MSEYDYKNISGRIQRTKDRRALIWRMEEEEANERKRIQSKSSLEIGNSDDAHEHHADSVAKKIVSGENASDLVKNQPSINNIPQKKEEEGLLMAKSEDGALKGTEKLQTTLDSSKGGGDSLDTKTQSEMGEKMGVDLSAVKIHTNSNANEMSEGINAKAFTYGQDIYFKEGQYNSSSTEGKSLLAHELTHTVQQRGNLSRQIQRKIGDLTKEQITAAKAFNLTVLKTELSIRTVQYGVGDTKITGKLADLTPAEIATYQTKNKATVNGKVDEDTLSLIFSALVSGTAPQYENAKDLVIDYYSINTGEAVLIKYDSSLKDAVSASFALDTLRKVSLGTTAFKDVATLKTSIETGLNTKNTATVSATTAFTATGSPIELSQKEKNVAVKVNNMLLKQPASVKVIAKLVSAVSKTFDDAFITAIIKYQWSKKQQGDKEVKDKTRTENPIIKETGIIDEDTFMELLNDLLQKDEFDLVLLLVDDYYKLNLKSLGYDDSNTEKAGYKSGTDPVTKKTTVSIGKSFFTEKNPKKLIEKLGAIKGIGALKSNAVAFKEWQEHSRIHNYFADGVDGYVALKSKLEALIKVKNPGKNAMEYLDEKIKTFFFLGEKLTLHENFITVLERVETKLKASDPVGYEEIKKKYGGKAEGFWVRTIAGTGAISQHSLGMAIDINPATNPHVKGEEIYKVITYVTGLEIYEKTPSPKELQDASIKFKSDFNATYITSLEKKKTSLDTFIKLSAKLSPQATLIKDITASSSIYGLTESGKPQTKERTDLITKITGFKTTLDSLTTEFNGVKADIDTKAQENFQSRLDNAKSQQQNLVKIGNGSADRKVAYDAVIANQKAFTVLYNSYSTISVSLTADQAKMVEILKAIKNNKAPLLSYGTTGFFDISLTLVNALIAEKEIRWGGNYEKNKDFMHFELHPLKDFL